MAVLREVSSPHRRMINQAHLHCRYIQDMSSFTRDFRNMQHTITKNETNLKIVGHSVTAIFNFPTFRSAASPHGRVPVQQCPVTHMVPAILSGKNLTRDIGQLTVGLVKCGQAK